MPVTQNLQVPYGSQNHILKGNLQHSTKSQRFFFLFSYNITFNNLGQGRLKKKIFGLNRHSKNACNSKSTSPIWITKLFS